MRYNKVMLGGRLATDIETSYTINGKTMSKFVIAIQDGKDSASFFKVVAFERIAELLSKHFSKGNKIFIEGRLSQVKYEKEGKHVEYCQIICDNFVFISSNNPNGKEKEVEENDTEKE